MNVTVQLEYVGFYLLGCQKINRAASSGRKALLFLGRLDQ